MTKPAIILVKPQLGENIGACARAMLNFGLTELRLVAPRDGWPNPAAEAMAAGATEVLSDAKVFDSVEAGIADLHLVFATTARSREMSKPVASPREAAVALRTDSDKGKKCGVIFGAERSGLDNDAVVLAHSIIHVPVNPSFGSLNLAQAVILIAYEWFVSARGARSSLDQEDKEPVATTDDMMGLFGHLEEELHQAGFFYPPEKTELMTRNIRNIFQRMPLTLQDVRTLRGIIKALSKGRPPRK